MKTNKIIMTQRSGHYRKKSPQQQKTHTTRLWLSKNTYTENWGEKSEKKKKTKKRELHYERWTTHKDTA